MILVECSLLIDIDTELSEINLGQVNFLHKFLVRRGNIIECEDTPTETEKKESAEGDESPEGKL